MPTDGYLACLPADVEHAAPAPYPHARRAWGREDDLRGWSRRPCRHHDRGRPWHVEGSDNAEWVLMDYVNIVVHVFQKHIREYYNIESLWGDAKITTIENKY